jgi:putative transposase
MIRTIEIQCKLPKLEADELNKASGEVYSKVCVSHWRAYKQSGKTWISQYGAMHLSDWQHKDSLNILHSHSIDAAQEGFYKAIKTARTNRKESNVENARFPYKRKYYRTTIWKTSGIRFKNKKMLLSRASGLEPIVVDYQTSGNVREVRLKYDLKQHNYFWHIVVEDNIIPISVLNGTTAAIDLGEIHPIAITDGNEVCIMSCRKLRSIAQGRNKKLAKLQTKLSKCQKDSRRAKKLKRAKRAMLAQFKRQQRDLLHKVSRETINWCKEKNVGTLAIGNVRNVADKTKEQKRLNRENRQNRQKISGWAHGMLRNYLGYKAEESGIGVQDRVSEKYTSQTCPICGHRYKPKGRNYKCSKCGFVFSRDGVGCSNILSRFLYDELCRIIPKIQKYRHPFWGKRSPADTRQVAIQAA